MTTTVQAAIARSIKNNEIVTIEFESTDHYDLVCACDDQARNRDTDTHEFWGTDADGDEWRVHMVGGPGSPARAFS